MVFLSKTLLIVSSVGVRVAAETGEGIAVRRYQTSCADLFRRLNLLLAVSRVTGDLTGSLCDTNVEGRWACVVFSGL